MKKENENNNCAICLDDCDSVVKLIPCKHLFHDSCLNSWMKYQFFCPLCRNKIEFINNTMSLNEYLSYVNRNKGILQNVYDNFMHLVHLFIDFHENYDGLEVGPYMVRDTIRSLSAAKNWFRELYLQHF